MMLDKKAPQPGTGWGCFACGLPQDEAILKSKIGNRKSKIK